jgi:hypothetical protein
MQPLKPLQALKPLEDGTTRDRETEAPRYRWDE